MAITLTEINSLRPEMQSHLLAPLREHKEQKVFNFKDRGGHVWREVGKPYHVADSCGDSNCKACGVGTVSWT